MSIYRQPPKRDKPEKSDQDRHEPSAKRSKQQSGAHQKFARANEDEVQVLFETRGVQQPPRRATNAPTTVQPPTLQCFRPTPQPVPARPQVATVQQFQARPGGGASVNSRRSGLTIPSAPAFATGGLPPTPDRSSESRLVELPFYKSIKELRPITTLGRGEGTLRFHVPSETATQMKDPRVLLLLRLFRTGNVPLLDEVPEDCVVKVNDWEINKGMPERVPTHRPNQPTQRKPRPIDLTLSIRRLLNLSVETMVCISINWKTVPGQRWSAGVWMVQKLDIETLFKNVVSNAERWLPPDVMLKRLQAYHNTDRTDDTLTMLSAPTVSLNCPITMARIRTPARGINCDHLDCFDLRNYLAMNECDPKWMCPICRREARYSNLRVDKYFEEILARAGGSLTRLELGPAGTWGDEEERAKQRQQQMAVVDSKKQTAIPDVPAPIEVNRQASSVQPQAVVAFSQTALPMGTSGASRAVPPAAEQATDHQQIQVDGQPMAVPQQVLETFKHATIFEDFTIVLIASSQFGPFTDEAGRGAGGDAAL